MLLYRLEFVFVSLGFLLHLLSQFQCLCEERVLRVQKPKRKKILQNARAQLCGCFKVLMCVVARLGAWVSDGVCASVVARSFQILPEALHQRAVIRPESSEGLNGSALFLRLNEDIFKSIT